MQNRISAPQPANAPDNERLASVAPAEAPLHPRLEMLTRSRMKMLEQLFELSGHPLANRATDAVHAANKAVRRAGQ